MHISCTSPGDGQTSCKVWLASGDRRRCSNKGKTPNPLKFAEVPQTNEPILTVSGPKCAVLWGYLEDICCFKNYAILLWPLCVADTDIIYLFILFIHFALSFLSSFFSFFSSPKISGRRLDVYHTSTHGVILVRI